MRLIATLVALDAAVWLMTFLILKDRWRPRRTLDYLFCVISANVAAIAMNVALLVAWTVLTA